MSEAKGPYTVEQDADSRQFVVKSPLGKCLYWSEYSGDCHRMAEQINATHHHALAAQAERVRVLENALIHIIEYWNRGENNGAMSDALYHMIETAETALTPPAKGDSNG